MTDEEWQQVKLSLSPPFGMAKLKIDGYDVTVLTFEDKPLQYSFLVYVNGKIRHECLEENCEIRRKFYRRSKKTLITSKDKQWLKRQKKAVREKFLKDLEYEVFSPCWKSFNAMKTHFIKNNSSIELLKEDK